MLRFGPKGRQPVDSFLKQAESLDLSNEEIQQLIMDAASSALCLSLQKTDRIEAPATKEAMQDLKTMERLDPIAGTRNILSCRS